MVNPYIASVITCLLISFGLNGQVPYWLSRANGSGNDEALDMVAYHSDYFITGYYSNAVRFGENMLFPIQDGEAYIARVSQDGNFLWSKTIGGAFADRGIAISVMSNGNVVVTGHFIGNIHVDNLTLQSTGPAQDIFMICYTEDGTLLWAKSYGDLGIDVVSDIQVDHDNNILMTGQFIGKIIFGPDTLTSAINAETNQPTYDIFVTKFDTQGNPIWSKQGYSEKNDRSGRIAVAPDNSFFLSGNFSDTLTFTNTYNNNSINLGFLIRFNTDGEEIWLRRIQSSVTEIADISCNDSVVFLTGRYSGNQRFTNDETITSWQDIEVDNTANKYYVAGYNYDGILSFSKSEGSSSIVYIKAVRPTPTGGFVLSGEFQCYHTDYQEASGPGLFLSRGFKDIFISEFSNNGTRLWAKQIGGIGEDEVNSMVINSYNKPVICGSFTNTLSSPARSSWGEKEWYYKFTHANQPAPLSYCGDPEYNFYAVIKSQGSKDVMLANIADLTRSTMDVFNRSPGACDYSVTSGTMQVFYQDSTDICSAVKVRPLVSTGPSDINGPAYSYTWNGSYNGTVYTPSLSGIVHLQAVANNTCYEYSDSLYVEYNPQIPNIGIQPNIGTILNASGYTDDCTKLYLLNEGDTVTFTGTTPQAPFEGYWVLPDGSIVAGSTITLDNPQEGVYEYFMHYPVTQCFKSKCVYVRLLTPSTPVCCGGVGTAVQIKFMYEDHILQDGDTLFGCYEDNFNIHLVAIIADTIVDPFTFSFLGQPFTTNDNLLFPDGIPAYSLDQHSFDVYLNSDEFDDGLTTIGLNFYSFDLDEVLLKPKVELVIVQYPPPEFLYHLTGDLLPICPGDTAKYELLTDVAYTIDLDLATNFVTSEDPLQFYSFVPQTYHVTFYDTTIHGCTDELERNFQMSYHQAPTILVNPSYGIICDEDTVFLSVPGATDITWLGPSGFEESTELIFPVEVAGLYYAVLTDTNNCELISNTVNLRERSSFGYELFPEFICSGDSAQIQLYILEGDIITWLPPLSGDGVTKYVTEPGIYQFTAPLCGAIDTFEVIVPGPEKYAHIVSSNDSMLCEGQTLTLNSLFSDGINITWLSDFSTNDTLIVDVEGTYILEVLDGNSCLTYDTLNVVTVPAYPPPAAPDGLTICGIDSVHQLSLGTDTLAWYIGISEIAITDTFTYYSSYADSTLSIASYNSESGCRSEQVVYDLVYKIPFESAVNDTSITLCSGTPLVLTYSPDADGANSNLWRSVNSNGIVNLWSDSILNIATVNQFDSGAYELITIGDPTQYCLNDTVVFYVNVLPLPEASVQPASNALCEGDTLNLTINTPEILTNGYWTIGNQIYNSDSLQFTYNPFYGPTLVPIAYHAIAQNGCSLELMSPIQQIQLPPNPIYSDSIFACSGENIEVALPFNQSVFWYLGSNQLTTTPQNSISYTASYGQEPLSIQAVDPILGVCRSEQVVIPATIKQRINIPEIADILGCDGGSTTVSFNAAAYDVGTYYWTYVNPDNFIAGNLPSLTLPSFPATIMLHASANENRCGVDSTIFTVDVETPPTINLFTGPVENVVCFNEGSQINVYWFLPADALFSMNTPGFVFQNCSSCEEQTMYIGNGFTTGLVEGTNTLYVELTSMAGCQYSREFTFTAVAPVSPPIPPSFSFDVCEGDTILIDPPGNGNYDWFSFGTFNYVTAPVFGSPVIGDVFGLFDPFLNYVAADQNENLYIAYSDPTTFCRGEIFEIPINYKPEIQLPEFTSQGICAIDSVVIEFLPAELNLGTYSWTLPDNSNSTDSLFVASGLNSAQMGTYQLIAQANENACGTDSATFTLESYPMPIVELTSDSLQVCTDHPLEITANTSNNVAVLWEYDMINSSANPLVINLPDFTEDSLSIFGTFTSEQGCVTLDTMQIAVYSTPEIPNLTVPSIVCAFDTISLLLNNVLGLGENFQYLSDSPFEMQGNQLNYSPDSSVSQIVMLSYIQTAHCVSDTLFTTIDIQQLPVFNLGNDSLLFCFGVGLQLEGPQGYTSYSWSTGETQENIEVFETGTYSLLVTDQNGCLFTDTIFVVGDWPLFALDTDTIQFCYNDPAVLAGPSGFDFYTWSTGSMNQEIEVNETGMYSLIITDLNGCAYEDSVFALGGYCEVLDQPNVFTPNGDDFNDKFKLSPYGYTSYTLVIHDRWGKFINEVGSVDDGWDGKDKFGVAMPEGTYYFVAVVNYLNKTSEEVKGMIQLMR